MKQQVDVSDADVWIELVLDSGWVTFLPLFSRDDVFEDFISEFLDEDLLL